jgi:uncharacterized protein
MTMAMTMATDLELAGVTAALLMGFATSAHCFGMCGGLATALGMRLRAAETGSVRSVAHASLYQTGRVGGYTLLGAVSGGFSQGLQSLLNFSALGIALRVASGALLLLVAVRMMSRWNGLDGLERLGARVWKRIQPLTRRLSGPGMVNTTLLGLAWGLLPCGMVYSALALAALSGSVSGGAALMLAFGVGTVPAMLGGTLMAARSAKLMSMPWAKRIGGGLLACLGAWLIVAPLLIHGHSGHLSHVH